MLVHICHEKSCKKRFDVYFGEQKLESGEEYFLPPAGARLMFVERNFMLGKYWFLLLLSNFFAGLLSGAFRDFSQDISRRTEICVELGPLTENTLMIRFHDSFPFYTLVGAPYAEIRRTEISLPQVERRIRGYKIAVIALILALLAAAILCTIFVLAK